VGLERVALVLPASAIPPPPRLIFVAAFGQQGVAAGTRVLDELRGLGLRADTDYRASTLKAHLRQADRLGAEYVVIIGDDEVTKGGLLVRNMRTKEQEELPFLTAARSLSSRLKTG
jgi:histidyl-tRNA synthetase